MWCAMSEYDDLNRTRTDKKTMRTFTSSVEFHVLCVDLGFPVVIGVGRLIVRFHHAYAIPSFLLDLLVRPCLVIVNSDCSHNSCMLHIAKTGPLRCCPYRLQTIRPKRPSIALLLPTRRRAQNNKSSSPAVSCCMTSRGDPATMVQSDLSTSTPITSLMKNLKFPQQ